MRTNLSTSSDYFLRLFEQRSLQECQLISGLQNVMSVKQKVQMYDLGKIGKSLNPNSGGYFCCVAKKCS